MDITLRLHADLGSAHDLASQLDTYIRDVMRDLRDEPPPTGAGESLLERSFDSEAGVVLTAHLLGDPNRVGFCVTGPLVDPLVGDSLPMVLALWVDPAWRHRGMARALVGRAREELAGRGFPDIAARAAHNDDALISMGERWGFIRSYEVMVRER